MSQPPGICIPAIPDISGIGVRIAIYAQNLLCFAPVVTDLWDGVVTSDEIKGVTDQSVGMLSIAFAILISTIVQATGNSSAGDGLSSFHAAIILDLSWMNNTSTWIWFLLYIHSRSKADKGRVPPTWKDWIEDLRSTLRDFTRGYEARPSPGESGNRNGARSGESGDDKAEGGEQGRHLSGESSIVNRFLFLQRLTSRNLVLFLQHLWNFTSQNPVLTLGSLHLSFMAAIGLWLWSDPTSFGTALHCVPSLSVVGGPVPFSSPELRVFSLIMYSLLVIPGVNLVPPFLFFLLLHISYNNLHTGNPLFCTRVGRIIHSIRSTPTALWGLARRFPLTFQDVQNLLRYRRRFGQRSDVESQSSHSPGRHSDNPTTNPPSIEVSDPEGANAASVPPIIATRTAFVIFGFACLVIIDVIMLIDVELTLRRNKKNQVPQEGYWSFGQVLALLLLIIPLRDFVKSVMEIRDTLNEAQKSFEEHLRNAIENDTFNGHDFRHWIRSGAKPNTTLVGMCGIRKTAKHLH